jgi:hypothetical protein
MQHHDGHKGPGYRANGCEIPQRFRCTGNALDICEETMKPDPTEKREVRYNILAYLCDNPDAGDTFEGIVEWWLLHQRIQFETRNISEAVHKLVAEGLILEDEGPDSRVTYRVNEIREQDIQSIVSQARQLRNRQG